MNDRLARAPTPGTGYPPQWVVRRITKGVADAGGVERRAAGGCIRAWEAVRGRETRLRGLGPGPRKGTSWGVCVLLDKVGLVCHT